MRRAFAALQRHEREGSRARVKLDRNLVVGQLMREQRRQRDLGISPLLRVNSGDRASAARASVRSHDELRLDAPSVGERRDRSVAVEGEVGDVGFDDLEVGAFARGGDQDFDEFVIRNIDAQRWKADLARLEHQIGRRQQLSCVVDHPDRGDRRGFFLDALQNAERVEKARRGFEQRYRASRQRWRKPPREHDVKSGARKSHRRRNAGRAGAGDENLRLDGLGLGGRLGHGFILPCGLYSAWAQRARDRAAAIKRQSDGLYGDFR